MHTHQEVFEVRVAQRGWKEQLNMLSSGLILFTQMHSLQTSLIYVQSDLTCFTLLRFGGFSHHFLNFCISGNFWQLKNLMREFLYMQDAKNMQAFCQLLSHFVALCFLMSGCYNLHTGKKKKQRLFRELNCLFQIVIYVQQKHGQGMGIWDFRVSNIPREAFVCTTFFFFFSNKWHTFPRSCGCQSWDWVSVAHLLISSLPVSRPLNQLWNKPARAF